MREQFTFYRSYFDAIRRLKKAADRAAIYDAIADYALYGNLPELSDAAGAIFDLIKPTLDAAKRKSDGAKGREKAQDDDKIPPRYGEDTDKIPSRCGEVGKNRNEKEKEKEREKEKEKEYEKESYILPPVVSPSSADHLREPAKKVSASRFTPPTVAEVAEYCRERGNAVDAERFCDFYAAKGWHVGKNTMKDWRAAVRTWEKRDEQDSNRGGDAFSAVLRREMERMGGKP